MSILHTNLVSGDISLLLSEHDIERWDRLHAELDGVSLGLVLGIVSANKEIRA